MMSKKDYDRKIREEQEAAAHVFQDFITSFQDNSGPPNKTFIKSGLLNPEVDQENNEKGQLYNPKPVIKQPSYNIKNAIECARILKENKIEKSKKDKPKSNLELLKEEIKLRHLERDERDKSKKEILLSQPPINYFDGGDPNSTNLFVANLNCKITENDLMLLFGAYGPLASVKIMWPRGEERLRNSNCGFVAFMSRKDAERALLKLKHRDDMRVGWGKSVELPSHPIYIPAELLKLFLPPPPTDLPFNAQPLNANWTKPQTEEEMVDLLAKSLVKVSIPLNRKLLININRTVEYVVREGPMFEAFIMNKELNNPDFSFLFNCQSQNHVYYRWKLFSILNGDSPKNWSMKPFRMFQGGSIWIPPVAPNFHKGMPDELIPYDDKPTKSLLSETQSNRLVQILRNLSMVRCKIAEAMVFCLNHFSAVEDVVAIIVDSLVNFQTNPLKKIARLYLLSDVLYNASMKKLNHNFEEIHSSNLLTIFKSLNYSLKNFKFSLDKENLELRITKILRHWDVSKLLSSDLIQKLECTFSNNNSDSVMEDDNSSCDEPLDGASLIKRSLKSNSPNVQMAFENHYQKTTKLAPSDCFVPSKWDTVDPEEVEAHAMSTEKLYYLELEQKLNMKGDSSNEINFLASKWDDSDEEYEGKNIGKKYGRKNKKFRKSKMI